MDPFKELPEEIYDHILRHFDVMELLSSLSLVSKRWYRVVGKSSVCMQKVRLNLRSKRKNDFVQRVDTLKWMSQKSSRQYLMIQANCLLNEDISLGFYNFLGSGNMLESLNLRSIKLHDEESTLSDITLPKLEYMKLMFVPREVINQLLLATSSLKTLILWNEAPLHYDNLSYLPSTSTIECVRKFMLNSQHLTELEIQGRANFYTFFQEDITDYVKCRLRKFTLKIEMSPRLMTDTQEKNFIKFLSTQRDSLEHIYVDMCGKTIFQYIFGMPNIVSIRCDNELQEPNRFDVNELELKGSEMISSFEMPYVKEFDDLKDYLNLVPNVKHLLIGHVVPRLMDYAATHLLQLETLIFRYDDCALECQQLYENMKKEKPEINQNIKLTVCNDFL